MKSLNISIVISTFNHNKYFDELIETLISVMKNTVYNFEVIIVNDGSDYRNIWDTIIRLSQKFKNLRGINLDKNIGQQKSIICGLSKTKGDLVITMDDDFKHNPKDIPYLISEILSNDDLMCVNCIYTNEKKNLIRNLGSKLFSFIIRYFYSFSNYTGRSSFRIIRRSLVHNIIEFRTRKPQIGPIITSLTSQIKSIFKENDDVRNSKSRHKYFDFVSMTIDSLIYVSNIPIKIFIYIGVMSIFISLFLSIYFLLSWYINSTHVPGFTSQVLLILFFGGLSLSGIGIIGIYIFRILNEITGPNDYLIKNDTDNENQ